MEFFWVLMFAGFIGLIPAIIARIKGQSFFAFWFFGAALFIVALPVAIVQKRNPNARIGIFDSFAMVFAGLYAIFFIGFSVVSLIVAITNQQAKSQPNKVMAASKPEKESEPRRDINKERRVFFVDGLNQSFPEKSIPFKAELSGENRDVFKLTSDSANLSVSESVLESVSTSEHLRDMKSLGFKSFEFSTPKLARKIDFASLKIPEEKFGDGTFIVGEDIEPGTYRTEGGDICYYERLRGFSGEFGDILANENATGPAIVAIKKTDKGFSSRGCGEWAKIK